jgi:CubicO group peptidase (beta-lactamase class C family)
MLACASGPTPPPQGVPKGDLTFLRDRLTYEIEDAMSEHEITSLSISVVDQRGSLYERSFGYADVGAGVFATPFTPYRWGSNSKVFVMLALLQLANAGKLDLDAPLTRYLPEFSIGPPPTDLDGAEEWKLDDVTLRRMLTHHSGLPNDLISGIFSRQPAPFQSVVPRVAAMHAEFPVDTVYSYSNVAFTLLGVVIERVGGEAFEDYMQHRLFQPLGMRSASFFWDDYLEQNVARSYDAEGKVGERQRLLMKPAGSLMASTHQMGQVASAILRGGVGTHGRFIEADVLAKSFEVQNQNVALDFDAETGLAWFLNPMPTRWFGKNAAHGGGLPHHYSAFMLLPDSQLAVVAATNSQRGAGAVQQLAQRALELALEAKTGMPLDIDRAPLDIPESDSPEEAVLNAWKGSYATPVGDLELRREGDHLEAEVFGRTLLLRPLEDGTMGLWAEWLGLFEVRPDELAGPRFALETVRGQRVVVRIDVLGRRALFATKYDPVAAPAAWRSRVGVYTYQAGPDEQPILEGFRLYIGKTGALMAQPLPARHAPEPPVSFALRPLPDGSMAVEGLGRTHGTRLSIDEGNVLNIGGGRFVRKRKAGR